MRADKFKVADFHCDVLSKMQASPDINFDNDPRLDVTAERLASGGVALQCFAIFLSTNRGKPSFEHVLGQIDLFRQKIVNTDGLQWLQWKEQVGNRLVGAPPQVMLSGGRRRLRRELVLCSALLRNWSTVSWCDLELCELGSRWCAREA